MNTTPITMLVNGTIEAPITGTTEIFMSDIIRNVCHWDVSFIVQMSVLLFVCDVIVGHTDYSLWFVPEKIMSRLKDISNFIMGCGIWILAIYMVYLDKATLYNKIIVFTCAILIGVDIIIGMFRRRKEFII